MSLQTFDAKLIKAKETGGISYIALPFNAKEVFNISKGKIRVKGTINRFEFRSSLLPKGNGNYILVIDKKMQKDAGIIEDEPVIVTMDLDIVSNESDITNSNITDIRSNMDVLTAIRTRRSIRMFTNQKVDDETLNIILDAGFCAPSAKNKRPWHFIVIREKNILKNIATNDSNHAAISGADICIVVCGDKVVQGVNDFLYEDCAAAIQNILLAIHGLGLAGVWCGFHSGSEQYNYLTETLKLPNKIIPIAMIAIGYPTGPAESTMRFDKSKIHLEKW